MQTGLNPALEILYPNDSITVINETLKTYKFLKMMLKTDYLTHREQRQYLPTEISKYRQDSYEL